MKKVLYMFIILLVLGMFASTVVAQTWSGPKFDARLGDPYAQDWMPNECKHIDPNNLENGADSIAAFGCYDEGDPYLSPEFMSIRKEFGIDALHVDYRIYTLPTWQSLTECSDLNEANATMKEEARAHHNYRQSFGYELNDADNEWEGYTVVWMARVEDLPGAIGMRVKAYAGQHADTVYTGERKWFGFEARYGCVDPDTDVFGPDNLVVRSNPDPATGHDYVNEFAAGNGSDMWHIYRIAVEVGETAAESKCNIYLDENPTPIIVTAEAKPDKGKPGNYIEFGVGGWNMPKTASMAFVLTTTEGAYGPSELALPTEYMDIYNTARDYQEDTYSHPAGWEGPVFDARVGDPYTQGWDAGECKHYDISNTANGADSVDGFGCYNVGHPGLATSDFMSIKEETGIQVLNVDYRVYSLPTWQSLTECSDLNEANAIMKEEARAHHNFRQSFRQKLDDADDEWEGYTITWMAKRVDLPGCIGMRVKAAGGQPAGVEYPSEKLGSGFEARYGCVDPDTDIFGPDNLVVRSGPDPATGHDYVNEFTDGDGSDLWHIYRLAVEVGATPAESKCSIYMDENPTPIIVTAAAKDEKGKPGNYMEFGVMGWNMPKVASIAWVLSTTTGAFGPSELAIPEEYMTIYNTGRDNTNSIRPIVVQEEGIIPDEYLLEQNYPNPFNPTTTLRYHIQKTEKVSLTIYNDRGQMISSLVNGQQKPGVYTVKWDGRDVYGKMMSSGVYFALLKTPSFYQAVKVTFIK